MSEASKTKYAGALDSIAKDIDQHEIHGMKYPNGSCVWFHDSTVIFEHLTHSNHARLEWKKMLTNRAAKANANLEEYLKGHVLVKRTVIISATEAEDVKLLELEEAKPVDKFPGW